MATNDFLPFAGGATANVLSQADYAALTALLANGFQSGTAQSNQVNKVLRQASLMSAALGKLIVDLSGSNATDDGTINALVANLKASIGFQSAGVVGSCRSMRVSIPVTSSAMQITADEIVVATALGGDPFRLGGFNQTVATTATGIGGVVGAPLTANGFAAVYAAYNPSTRQQGAFITNANSLVPQVASSPPPGWTATALASIRQLDSAGNFTPGAQRDRRVFLANGSGFFTSTPQSSFTSIAVPGLPMNAVRIQGTLTALSSVAGVTQTVMVATDALGSGQNGLSIASAVANNGQGVPIDVDVLTPQTLWYKGSAVAGGTPSYSLAFFSFDF